MEVRHGLPGLSTVVHDQPEVVTDPTLARDASNSLQQPAPERLVVQLRESLNVLSRHDQDMEGRPWENVVDRHDVVVLIDDRRGDLPGHDAAEQAVVHAAKRIPTCP